MFKVEQDQLRVSDGWVRCGRCETVFDALESLDDQPPLPHRDGLPASAGAAAGGDDPWSAGIDIDELLKRRVEAQVVEPPLRPEPADADGGDNTTLVDTPADIPPAASDTLNPPAATAATTASIPVKPQFVRRAEREARWHSPAMRIALAGTSLILLLMLAAQVAYHRRDHFAARSPAMANLLSSACTRWGCTIGAPRDLGQLAIEHSALSREPRQPDALQLALRIANRSDVGLALPAIELSLTDAQGRLIARRALLPSDFADATSAVVEPRAELPLSLRFSTGEHTVAGYTVELFYP